MTFSDYTIKYFKEFFEKMNNKNLVKEAKILLKMIDDINDEGYHSLKERLDNELNASIVLINYIKSNNEVPFTLNNHSICKNITYCNEEIELENFLLDIENNNKNVNIISNSFLYNIYNYSVYLSSLNNDDTSYIFLLRDCLLPYLYFKKKNIKNVYPILIGRKYLNLFSNEEDEIYDSIHNALFEGLNKNNKDFNIFKNEFKKVLLNDLINNEVIKEIKKYLLKIQTNKIIVVESGYCGSIPMILSILDDRIDFRMFSTIPYFYNVYKGKIFTYEFEKMRLFETIQVQDSLFTLNKVIDNKYYINVTNNSLIKEKAKEEINEWYSIIEQGGK